MKSTIQWLCVALMALSGHMALGDPPGDPLRSLLIPPEVLIQNRARIGLTPQQVAEIHSCLEKFGPKAKELQGELNQTMGRLVELLSSPKPDENAVLKQLDAVLAIENEQKRRHFRMMVQIRNHLTTEQQDMATKLRRNIESPQALEQRLKSKLSRIEKEFRSRTEAGRQPFDAAGLMQKFPELMQNGQVEQAEALLNQVMAMLDLKERENEVYRPPAPDSPLNDTGGTDRRTDQSALPKVAPLSPDRLLAEVEGLKTVDVAWRKIPWKNCLLDGLTASREQDKPVICWVFIDRPVDDDRC
jgi:hypothetical protein